MPDPASILIIRPSALGDVCRSVPVLASLRRRYPDARIDWLVQAEFAPAVAAHPDLSNIVPFHRTRMTRGGLCKPAGLMALRDLLASLRAPRYDLVLDCQGLLRSGIFSWWTRAPRRLTYADAAEHAARFATERVEAARTMHTVDRMLRLAEAAGAPPLADLRLTAPPPAETERDDIPDRPFAIIAPTSRWPGKRWPDDRFAGLAEALVRQDLVELVLIVGAPSERDQCPETLALAAREPRVVDRIGPVSIGGLMRLVERARLVVANDSAALHMAVGFDRPTVALFGPTRTDLVGPYERDADVLQPEAPGPGVSHKDEAAGAAMMRRIDLQAAVDACAARLAATAVP